MRKTQWAADAIKVFATTVPPILLVGKKAANFANLAKVFCLIDIQSLVLTAADPFH